VALCGLTLLVAAPAAASAAAKTETASLGDVTAKFSYAGHYPRYHNQRLTISRAGVVAYSQAVVSPVCGHLCAPGLDEPATPSVHVLDLEHSGSPDVVLDLFSGGAHCCSIEQVFSFDPPTGTYVKTERNFGDPGEQIVDLRRDGHYQFLTADDAFAYAFTDYAASGLPIQILTFSHRRFHNITRRFPKLIAADARRWLRLYRGMARSGYVDSVGVIAAWAADQELLGHRKLVDRTLAREDRAHHLNSLAGPGGKKFIAALKRLLRRDGYLR
jgi:hypothetical protein